MLGRGEGYVGVAAVMGSRFSVSESDLRPVLEELKGRGLMFLDNRAGEHSVATRLAQDLGLPPAANDRTLNDGHASHAAIDARLGQIERVALSDGASVAMAQPDPATIERLQGWAGTLEARGFALVPITAVAGPRAAP